MMPSVTVWLLESLNCLSLNAAGKSHDVAAKNQKGVIYPIHEIQHASLITTDQLLFFKNIPFFNPSKIILIRHPSNIMIFIGRSYLNDRERNKVSKGRSKGFILSLLLQIFVFVYQAFTLRPNFLYVE